MVEPPELAYETATPAELLKRLDILRERLRLQLMSVADFNTAIKAFQFTDEVGHLWAPGATTSKWYRWDASYWTQAPPPATLRVPQAPVMFNDLLERSPAAPVPASCGKCGAPLTGKKFCTVCGAKVS